VLLVAAIVVAAAVVLVGAALARGESEAYEKGRDVGVALFKSGTPIEKCANVRQGARLPDLDSVEEQQEFYEGCLAGWEDAAGDR
jgi:hypothetical protein